MVMIVAVLLVAAAAAALVVLLPSPMMNILLTSEHFVGFSQRSSCNSSCEVVQYNAKHGSASIVPLSLYLHCP